MRVTASGYTTGTVAMFTGSTENEQILNFTNPGSFFFNEKNFMVLERVGRPVFLLTGSPTTNPYISMFGISIHMSLFGKYLLGG
jgi:N12 class adenine-specific DNA methylase